MKVLFTKSKSIISKNRILKIPNKIKVEKILKTKPKCFQEIKFMFSLLQ